MESALFVGDKFVSQFMALHMLILCAYKFLTAFGIKFGSDGSGLIKCRMIWKTQCIGDFFFLLLMRMFSSAALTASLDLRWHLMMVGYEAFILGKCTPFCNHVLSGSFASCLALFHLLSRKTSLFQLGFSLL